MGPRCEPTHGGSPSCAPPDLLGQAGRHRGPDGGGGSVVSSFTPARIGAPPPATGPVARRREAVPPDTRPRPSAGPLVVTGHALHRVGSRPPDDARLSRALGFVTAGDAISSSVRWLSWRNNMRHRSSATIANPRAPAWHDGLAGGLLGRRAPRLAAAGQRSAIRGRRLAGPPR